MTGTCLPCTDNILGMRQLGKPVTLCACQQVLVLSSGLVDAEDLVWWQPYESQAPTGDARRHDKAWLPAAIEVDSQWQASQVRQNRLVGNEPPCGQPAIWYKSNFAWHQIG